MSRILFCLENVPLIDANSAAQHLVIAMCSDLRVHYLGEQE